MADLATQETSLTGQIMGFYSCDPAGDTFLPNRRTVLAIRNSNSEDHTVTIRTPHTVKGLDIADANVVANNGWTVIIGPFEAQHFADPTTGRAHISYSGTDQLTIAVIEIPLAT